MGPFGTCQLVDYMGVGERIAEERKRLGLSQHAFADRVGVSLSSQKRYEKGDRAPDTGYLEGLKKQGIDVRYVVSGERPRATQTAAVDAFHLAHFGRATLELLGFSREDLVALARTVEKQMDKEGHPDDDSQAAIDANIQAYIDAFKLETSSLLKASPLMCRLVREAAELDSDLLCSVIENFETMATRAGLSIIPRKKAKALAMLYRSFKASGRIDPQMVTEAVTLAAD